MDSDEELSVKRIKFMNPYVQLNKAFIIKATPSIVKQFNNENTSDVKVILGEEGDGDVTPVNRQVLHLHKIVLSSASLMFATWVNKYSHNVNDTILRIPENFSWMPDFFRFFYTGHIMMTSENLVDIYTIADKYLVESLKIQCEDYIKESLKIKVEKMTCPHVKSILSKCSDQDSCSAGNPDTLPFYDPYQSLLRTRSGYSYQSGANIFSNYNQLSSKNLNNSRNMPLQHGNSISIFNSNTNINQNSKNIFSRSFYDVYEKKNPDFDLSNSKMDLFCDKCNPGPLTVSRVLAFTTVVHLTEMTCNTELTKLARYNLMIRLTEELRSEDYSQFIQLPFQLLYELLEDDNFYCSEFHLFCAIQHWIQSNKLESSKSFFPHTSDDATKSTDKSDPLKSQADKLISLIRFPVMSAEELYDVESSASSSGHFSEVLLQNLLHQALRYMVYRNVQKAKMEESWIGIPYKPRVPVEIIKLGMQSLS